MAMDHAHHAALTRALAMENRAEDRARDQYRHPFETLDFFQVKPGMTVVDYMPASGWYTRVLVPYLGEQGRYVGLTPDPAAADGERFANYFAKLPGDFVYRSARYAPALKVLIAKDDACAEAGGGICVIDAVPFCDCQDTGSDYKLVSSTVVARGDTGARVTVQMRNGGPKRYSVDLVLIKGQWFVSDIATPTTPSFAAKLRKGLKSGG